MKRFLLSAALFCVVSAIGQIRLPAPSSTQTITQEFGIGSVTLTYSRPSLKGRTVFRENSELAPLNKLWRTGANAATHITFTEKTMMGGKLLDTGTYVLYTIPGKEYWEIVLNKGLTNWGSDGYKESEDVNRFKVRVEKSGMETETFTMGFSNVMAESCELFLTWGNALVKIPLSVNVKDRIRAQVERALSNDKADAGTYTAAANFYYQYDKNLPLALSNASKAAAANPKSFSIVLLQAKIQRDMGDKVSAKASAEKVITMATEAKNDDYVKQAQELLKKL